MNGREFVILSDAGSLRAGNTTLPSLDKLKANGFEQVNYSEDFLCALADGEYAIFIAGNEKDIECLYDETNISSLSYRAVEVLLGRYRQSGIAY